MDDKAIWTFMVYTAGDNNLPAAGEKDPQVLRKL